MTRIDAPTPYVWIIGRTKTDGPQDYDAVHKIQAGYKVTPLSQWGRSAAGDVTIDPSVDMKTPPKMQVDTMPADKYFAYAAELLKVIPPHITDQPMVAQMKRIGIEPGKSFELDKANPAVHKALESAPEEAQQLMAWKLPTLARVANGWSMNTDTMGVYGNYYLKRAIVAQLGLGANFPRMPSIPSILADEAGKPLDGANKYTIHFDKGARRPRTPSGRSHCMTPKVFRSQTTQPVCRQQLDAIQVQRRRIARSVFPERKSRRGQGSQLASGSKRPVQLDHAPLRAEIGGAHRKVESAAGHARVAAEFRRSIGLHNQTTRGAMCDADYPTHFLSGSGRCHEIPAKHGDKDKAPQCAEGQSAQLFQHQRQHEDCAAQNVNGMRR